MQDKRSKDPGDTREMVDARTRFLDTGCYAPIADAVGGMMQSSTLLHVLDAGCGEGYYLDRLSHGLPAHSSCIGLDISKPAIIAATRRNRNISWIVGTNRNLPVLPQSLDAILCLFGFPVYPAFARALKPQSYVLQVDPAPDHLQELRTLVYDTVRKDTPPDFHAPGFRITAEQHVRFETRALSHAEIMDLLLMTPHYFRAQQGRRAALDAADGVVMTVDVVLRKLVPHA